MLLVGLLGNHFYHARAEDEGSLANGQEEYVQLAGLQGPEEKYVAAQLAGELLSPTKGWTR